MHHARVQSCSNVGSRSRATHAGVAHAILFRAPGTLAKAPGTLLTSFSSSSPGFLSCCAISDPASPIFSLSSAAASQRTKPSTRRRASSCSTPDRYTHISLRWLSSSGHRCVLAVRGRRSHSRQRGRRAGQALALHMCNERPHGVRAPSSSSRVRCEAARVASSSPFLRPAGRLHARRCYRRASCPTVGGRPGPPARELPAG
mmetsp:Transcript_20902/g.49720  ORF Transcript_20902/g.49720 Transcript_20902/m.49720 type:complete len:202 (+) Transcript_20902:740-1345(+)